MKPMEAQHSAGMGLCSHTEIKSHIRHGELLLHLPLASSVPQSHHL